MSFVGAYYYKFNAIDSELLHGQYFSLLIFFNLSWLITSIINNIYKLNRIIHFDQIFQIALKSLIIYLTFIAAYLLLKKALFYSREHFVLFFISFSIVLILWRFSMNQILHYFRKSGYNFKKVIIVGLGNSSLELANYFKTHSEWGYKFEGFFDNETDQERALLKGSIGQLPSFVLENNIDEIYCSLEDLTKSEVKQIIEFADNNYIRLKILPNYGGFVYKDVSISLYENIPIMNFRKIPLDDISNRIVKRTFDIIVSFLTLFCILSWLFPIIAILIKYNSKGPVFFKQIRSGKNNADFFCYKFRTMYLNDQENDLQATKNDLRITPFGAFLRKTSIDELPQFYNVLMGNMSVVGPRPHMLKHTKEYSQVVEKYMVRHFVKPGITGLAQAKGFRGETTNCQIMKNRIRLDLIYIENWSLWFDIKIILLTIKSIFKSEAF